MADFYVAAGDYTGSWNSPAGTTQLAAIGTDQGTQAATAWKAGGGVLHTPTAQTEEVLEANNLVALLRRSSWNDDDAAFRRIVYSNFAAAWEAVS